MIREFFPTEPRYDLRVLLNTVFQRATMNPAETAGEMKPFWHASTTLFCPLRLFICISMGHVSYLLYTNSCTHYLLKSLSLFEISDLDVCIPIVREFSTVYGQYWLLNKWMKSE